MYRGNKMIVKSLDEIWQDYLDHDKLPIQTRKDLKWWLKNEEDPAKAILMIADMHLSDMGDLAPLMAMHLDHQDDYIREITVGCLIGRLFQSQYAEKGFEMAKNDPHSGVRNLAIYSLGVILDETEKKLQKSMAEYIYKVLTEPNYSKLHKQAAYHSVIEAMKIPLEKWPKVKLDPDLDKLIDKNLLNKFCDKYKVQI